MQQEHTGTTRGKVVSLLPGVDLLDGQQLGEHEVYGQSVEHVDQLHSNTF